MKESMKHRKALESCNHFKQFVADFGVTILTTATMHLQALDQSKLNS